MKELKEATTNQGKVKEIQAMLKDLNIEVKSLKDVYDDDPDIVEDGKTFKENALIKAKYVADDLHKIVLADDSSFVFVVSSYYFIIVFYKKTANFTSDISGSSCN